MKIGFLSRLPPEKCGISIYSGNLVSELKKSNLEIVTIGTKNSESDYKINFSSLNLKEKLERIIKKERINLLHIQYIAPFFGRYDLNYNIIRAFSIKIPIITTLHEVQYSSKGLKNKILARIEKEIVKKSNIVIVHTPNQKRYIKEKYNKKNIECTYMGLYLKKEHPRKGKKILFFGILSHNKGIEYLISSMKYLKDYKLTIAGSIGKNVPITYKEKLIKKASINNLKNVKFDVGWVSEEKKAQYYKNADIIVLPYVWAPYQSAVLHDAFSYGIPVVVTKTGAVWEIVDLYKTGAVVKPKSPKAIAEGIKKVTGNYDKYKKGIRRYKKEANWKAVAAKHIYLYKKLIS